MKAPLFRLRTLQKLSIKAGLSGGVFQQKDFTGNSLVLFHWISVSDRKVSDGRFVIALPFLYLGFYLAFRFCKIFFICSWLLWACLISQILASCSFVFFVFMLGMKIRFGNRFLHFMGGITLEFYLIHGLFVELFGYHFADATHSLYYIRNVALMTLVFYLPSVPAAMLLQRFHKFLIGKLTGHK